MHLDSMRWSCKHPPFLFFETFDGELGATLKRLNMKILVVGSGGREHALAWALKKSARHTSALFCAPGNAGIAEIAQCLQFGATDVAALARFAEEEKIDLTVVGGEASLAA